MPIVVSGGVDASKSLVLWNNILNISTITQSGTQAGYPAINAAKDPATWSEWRASSGGATYMQANIPAGGGNRIVNAVGISAHNLATTATNVSIQYSSNGTDWTLATAIYSPLTNEDIILYFPTVNAQYWRINMLAGLGSIGVVFLGNALLMPHTPVDSYVPLHHARQYNKMFNDSIKGHFLGNRVMAAGAETDIDFGFVQRDWADGPLRGFEDHYNKGGTFFYAGWPGGKPQDIGYCRARGEDEVMSVEYIEADKLTSLSFGVRAYVGT